MVKDVALRLQFHSLPTVVTLTRVDEELRQFLTSKHRELAVRKLRLVRAMLQKFSTQVADCYERAGESRARAAAAANENDKTEYLNIERRWIMLARSYELNERITGFADEVKRRLRVLIPPAPPHPAVPNPSHLHRPLADVRICRRFRGSQRRCTRRRSSGSVSDRFR